MNAITYGLLAVSSFIMTAILVHHQVTFRLNFFGNVGIILFVTGGVVTTALAGKNFWAVMVLLLVVIAINTAKYRELKRLEGGEGNGQERQAHPQY